MAIGEFLLWLFFYKSNKLNDIIRYKVSRSENMIVLFCCNPLDSKEVDVGYLNEYNAAKNQRVEVGLINYEELVNNNPIAATRKIFTMPETQIAVFRGWMMKPSNYEELYKALLAKNIKLVNSPYAYKHCHYLPESYDLIKGYTPKTVWVSKNDLDKGYESIHRVLKVFGEVPVIVKDYVKSRKHEWFEACYIPNALDVDKVNNVVKKFIELQDDDLNEGIVFREFLKLEFLANHMKSKMPLSKEYRIFFIDGKPVYVVNYWDEGDYGDLKPELAPFLDIAKKIQSRFFTMDIAKVENNGWIIMELGDGQVSGLPNCADVECFYRGIKKSIDGGLRSLDKGTVLMS